MVQVKLPDDLVDAIRPHVENEWERDQREQKKKVLAPTEVILRALQWVYEQKTRGKPKVQVPDLGPRTR